MSLLVLGVSHRTAPVPVLERVVLPEDGVGKLLDDVSATASVAEVMVLSTCNRLEVYVDAPKFHPAVDALQELLARYTGLAPDDLTGHLFVHYEDRAVQHLFSVTAGLDSMVVGEAQVLGQVRSALRLAQEHGSVGRSLNDAVQTALRVAKRAHTETGVDAAGASLVSVGLSLVERSLPGLANRPALVVGAGAMAALAARALHRSGAVVSIANRTAHRAERLAAQVGGQSWSMADLPSAIAACDLAVTCTGAVGSVVTAEAVREAQERRAGRPLVLLDLALPRDVDPAVLAIPGVTLVDLEDLADLLVDGTGGVAAGDVESARRIVSDEVEMFLDGRHADRVTPLVVALRGRASEIVTGELAWFDARLRAHDEELSAPARADVAQLVGRVVDKLLHAPSVRVRELAGGPDGDTYAEALHQLFDLDPRAVEALAATDPAGPAPT